MFNHAKSQLKRYRTTIQSVGRRSAGSIQRSPYEIICSHSLLELRHYGAASSESGQPIPILLVPPLMARSLLFDLSPGRSFVQYLISRNFSVYVIDWKSPEYHEANISVEHYAQRWLPQAIEAIQEHSGAKKISLFGYCLGGLFCLWYLGTQTQLWPGKDNPIANMVMVATPIDTERMGFFSQIGQGLAKPIEAIARRMGNIPGALSSRIFQLTNPSKMVSKWWDLWKHMGEAEYLSNFSAMEEWFGDFTDFPQKTFLQVFQDHIVNNLSYKDLFELGGCHVDLQSIRLPVLAFAGDSDKIVHPDAIYALENVLGSDNIRIEMARGGHAGVIAGRQAANDVWKIAADWLEQQSLGTN